MDYIKVYDNVVTKEFCDHMITKFHDNKDVWENHDNNIYTFNQINLPNNLDIFGDEVDYLMQLFDAMIYRYGSDCNLYDFQFPETYGFEAIRMKHYKEGVGKFQPHTDVMDAESMKRFLVFFLYLDEGEGGETALYDQNIKIERKPGRLLMFPPTWTYPHAGMMPIKNDKHIIGSYLHYV